jgi:hypothetical protein
MKQVIMAVIMAVAVTIVVSAYAAQTILCVRYFESAGSIKDPLVEEFYQGTGPLDITMPCVRDKHDYDVVTDNIYGIIAKNSGPLDQGDWALTLIPPNTPLIEIRLGSGRVTTDGCLITPGFDMFNLRICWATAQYQNAKLHLTWANPNNINWKVTMYRKGRS